MTVDLDRLERLAAEATPGPWETAEPGVGGPKRYVQQDSDAYPKMMGTPVCSTMSSGRNKHAPEDADFIAACDPETVLALCRVVRAAQRVLGGGNLANRGLLGLDAALDPFRGPVAAAEDAG